VLLSLACFGMAGGNYGIILWLPQIIKDTITTNPQAIGWISTIPWASTVVAMNLWGYHSATTGERRWHMADCHCRPPAFLLGCAQVSPSLARRPGAALSRR
jgi:ACS family tartrate transporter-like MFS transporter